MAEYNRSVGSALDGLHQEDYVGLSEHRSSEGNRGYKYCRLRIVRLWRYLPGESVLAVAITVV